MKIVAFLLIRLVTANMDFLKKDISVIFLDSFRENEKIFVQTGITGSNFLLENSNGTCIHAAMPCITWRCNKEAKYIRMVNLQNGKACLLLLKNQRKCFVS